MSSNPINDVGAYFNANWELYQEPVNANLLFHKEMFNALSKFLNTHYGATPFSLVDVGCGDSSAIAATLVDKPIKKYLGIDAAPDILKMAAVNLQPLDCEKTFLCDDMVNAIAALESPVDIIFSSYTVHHLSSSQKFDFIQTCKDKLAFNGVLLMVDCVLENNQTRDEWLNKLRIRYGLIHRNKSAEEIELFMQHPSANDYPDSIHTFETMAKIQDWKHFQVIVDKGLFAFVAFYKNDKESF